MTISGSYTGMNKLWRDARARRDHRWAPQRMSDYLDGELATRDRRRVERHTQECEECRGILRGLQRMVGKLRDVAAPAGRPDPRDLAARVKERIATDRPKGASGS